MATKLGEIQRPPLERFREGRKLYCVPLLPYVENGDVPKDYQEKVSIYWSQVAEQIESLEKAGKVSKIFHESVFLSGDEAVDAIKGINKKSYELVRASCEEGATVQALEDKDLLDEYLDWTLCLSVVGRSRSVVEKVIDFQAEAAKKREEYISKKINETLGENEAGMLIMTDENRIRVQPKLASDIQVFLVHPPAFDDVQRWLRDYMLKRVEKEDVDRKGEKTR